jgi:hypothetical protein
LVCGFFIGKYYACRVCCHGKPLNLGELKMDKTDWIQAWDDYKELTRKYEDSLKTIQRAKDNLEELKEMATLDYNKAMIPLLPYIKDKICEELELSGLKAGEELREMTPLEKEGL